MPSPAPVLMPFFTSPAQNDPWLTPAPKHLYPLPTRPHTPGLQNLGNTCFLNAALQCLLHTPLASLLIHSGPHTNADPHHARFCAFCALQHLAKLVHRDSASRVIAPKAFANNASLVCTNFRIGRQEDAHEFVRALLDGMTRAEVLGCDRARAGGGLISWQREMQADVHKVFGGMLESRLACRSCRHVSVTTEPFLDLSLETSRVSSVDRALERFTAEEILQGDSRYRCEACKKLVVAAKRFSVRRAPNVLTLHLKRFDRNRKDNRFVHYPQVLDLAPYMIGRPKGTTATYTLTGVLIHQGSSRQYGHYFSYVKGTNKSWCLKDDSTSRTVSAAHVMKQKAYILFYTRTDGRDSAPISKASMKSSIQPVDIVKSQRTLSVPDLNLSIVNGTGDDQELVLSEESSSEDDLYRPTRDRSESIESEESGEEEEILRKGEPQKRHGSPPKGHSKENVPASPTKPSVGKGIAMRFSEVRKKASEVSPARKVLGPMARRMEGKGKQSNVEAAKKAVESLKEPESSYARRFLGPVGRRFESKPSPESGDAQPASRTVSEPSLVHRRILSPFGRRLSNNSTERAAEKSSDPSPRRFLGPLIKRGEPKPAEIIPTSTESGDETEPSERNSSAEDEEEPQAPSSMREVLIGGGSAVRKVMHRVFGVALPGSRSDKKKPSDTTTAPPSSSNPPEPIRKKSSPPPSPSKLMTEISLEERQTQSEPRSGTSSLFKAEGVDKWDSDPTLADRETRKSFTRSRIVKRRRANDILDAEYDRGKVKKTRVRYNQGKPRSNFGAALERRRRSEVGKGAA